ncbi:glycosyltransferase family 2 protein [Chitinophaga varians]|uniref:glycosyltransferase family 2 protein n=1 Tax=Chitinophaga varians TaxID=2202339 RepID=UPI00165EC11A|nr:glycosyltransferase family A protein [Chitinophaga varians]MBC9913414.1 glycosyltransferase family 2 protein [Chitinophaga varians]
MDHHYPVISCVCITRAKPAMLQRAITCFQTQSYPEKELIVVYEEDDAATADFVRQYVPDSNIRFISISIHPKQTLGELRNIGIREASGTFICQWDDDDWYHQERLTRQYQALLSHQRDGAVLTEWIVFDATQQQAYISNTRIWEGSILCKKEILQQKPYESRKAGEDTATVEYLTANNHLHPLSQSPGLYIYIYHGGNTWHHQHWSYIFACSHRLNNEHTTTICEILNGEHSISHASQLLDNITQLHYHQITQ